MYSEPMEPIGSHDGFAYFGEREGWLIAEAQHRDSEALERSNFHCFTRAMEDIDPSGEHYAVESMNHWAVGWVEYLLVEPGSACEAVAIECRERLADYPVLDEENWSNEEYAEALEVVTSEVDGFNWRTGRTFDRDRMAALVMDHHPMMEVDGAAWFINHGFDTYRYNDTGRRRDPVRADDRDTLAWAIRQYRKAERKIA